METTHNIGKQSPRVLAVCLLGLSAAAAIVALSMIYSKWVFAGAGLAFIFQWIWIRIETGIWVDSLEDVTVSVRNPAPKGSMPQPPMA